MVKIANATTEVAAEKSIAEITAILTKHGATEIMSSFSNGTMIGLTFIINTKHGDMAFKLPANIDKVYSILIEGSYLSYREEVKVRVHKQAERTAWRILKDWVRAQIALIQTEQVEIQQVFLPYLQLNNGKTLYQSLNEGGFKALLQGPESSREV
jgi:hypothetical protein